MPESFDSHEPGGARADVALRAAHARVRRVEERGVLGRHHRVAGQAAELRRVHVLDALVGRGAQDGHVQHGGAADEEQHVAHGRGVEVDAGVLGRDTAFTRQPPPVPEDADGNQDQAQDEQEGQDKKEGDADVGMDRVRARDLEEPEPDQGQRRGRCQRRSQHADPVVSEMNRQAQALAQPSRLAPWYRA